jgi:hypothetical protein
VIGFTLITTAAGVSWGSSGIIFLGETGASCSMSNTPIIIICRRERGIVLTTCTRTYYIASKRGVVGTSPSKGRDVDDRVMPND